MSYEICVLDPQIAVSREAAFNAWNDGVYMDTSRPDTDRSAPKWRIREALSTLDSSLMWKEPKPPRTRLIAALMGKETPPRLALSADLPEGDESINFYVYDQAVELDLPWSPDPKQTDAIVRDMWRYLEKLSQIGMNAIYDTERDVMLDLASDFDAVLKRYLENIKDENEDEGEAEPKNTLGTQTEVPTAIVRNTSAPRAADAPFTGNAGDGKPWWKIWQSKIK